jgi:sialic acid synthase SpsE
MKFCFRDINSLIHKDFRHRTDISLIKRFQDTPLSWDDYQTMVTITHNLNMTSVAMPFDDFSVEKCAELGIQIIEIPTSNIIDWPLIKKIVTIKKPTLIATSNCSLLDLDDVVSFFCDRDIPLCINHCIAF